MPHTKYSIVCYSILNQCEVASNMSRFDGIEYGYRSQNKDSVKQLFTETRSSAFNDIVRSRILAGNYFLLSRYIFLQDRALIVNKTSFFVLIFEFLCF